MDGVWIEYENQNRKVVKDATANLYIPQRHPAHHRQERQICPKTYRRYQSIP